MIEINLIPNVKRELLKAQRIRSRVIAGSILIGSLSSVVVVLLALYVFTFQYAQGALADSEITKQSNILKSVEDLSKTLTIQNQLTKISLLNSSKKIDSRIFDVLNAIIPPAPNDIQISSLEISSDSGSVAIDGEAGNGYAAVEVFRKTLEGANVSYKTYSSTDNLVTPLASSISTSSTSYGENAAGKKVLRFSISFQYAPELLSPTSKNVSIVVPAVKNATDSYLGLPKSIFVNPAKDITSTGGGQ